MSSSLDYDESTVLPFPSSVFVNDVKTGLMHTCALILVRCGLSSNVLHSGFVHGVVYMSSIVMH